MSLASEGPFDSFDYWPENGGMSSVCERVKQLVTLLRGEVELT